MDFHDALEFLESNLKKYLGFKLPDTTFSGLQFTNIMHEFIDSINETAPSKESSEANLKLSETFDKLLNEKAR